MPTPTPFDESWSLAKREDIREGRGGGLRDRKYRRKKEPRNSSYACGGGIQKSTVAGKKRRKVTRAQTEEKTKTPGLEENLVDISKPKKGKAGKRGGKRNLQLLSLPLTQGKGEGDQKPPRERGEKKETLKFC